jgi:hypothetical protein
MVQSPTQPLGKPSEETPIVKTYKTVTNSRRSPENTCAPCKVHSIQGVAICIETLVGNIVWTSEGKASSIFEDDSSFEAHAVIILTVGRRLVDDACTSVGGDVAI